SQPFLHDNPGKRKRETLTASASSAQGSSEPVLLHALVFDGRRTIVNHRVHTGTEDGQGHRW
ncbi:MAG: hypothetical protein ABL983_22575, partial [Nitrospira sp.]